MGRCWTCGSGNAGGLLGHWWTCPDCGTEKQLKKIRERLESSPVVNLNAAIELVGLGQLSEELSGIASTLEWGFEEINWRLDQVNHTLSSIDKTLKTPSQTQAKEWREIAEELRRRGVLDESEEFFLKSLKTNPLDYRTYIGIGKTYLQMDGPQKARTYWEKSLPHAPKSAFDYKSYSHRLIGRTYFCEDDAEKAAQALETAIQLSPYYYIAHYDYALYSALLGHKEACLSSLKIAVSKEAIPVAMVRSEGSFAILGQEVENLQEAIDPWEHAQRAWLRKIADKKITDNEGLYAFEKAQTELLEIVRLFTGRVVSLKELDDIVRSVDKEVFSVRDQRGVLRAKNENWPEEGFLLLWELLQKGSPNAMAMSPKSKAANLCQHGSKEWGGLYGMLQSVMMTQFCDRDFWESSISPGLFHDNFSKLEPDVSSLLQRCKDA
jgi:tetratricopeptide (TPR) repeat protein